jgi:hypothetical protein
MRHGFRSALGEVRELPLYPFLPFVPLGLFAVSLGLQLAILARVERLARKLEQAELARG